MFWIGGYYLCYSQDVLQRLLTWLKWAAPFFLLWQPEGQIRGHTAWGIRCPVPRCRPKGGDSIFLKKQRVRCMAHQNQGHRCWDHLIINILSVWHTFINVMGVCDAPLFHKLSWMKAKHPKIKVSDDSESSLNNTRGWLWHPPFSCHRCGIHR